jgi:tRNA U38,U39,U40 pseudouridine synthase TruA
MMEMEASEFRYVNRTTMKVTDAADPEGIEFVRFYLKGQSFLYNQIRKMVGCMI